MHYAVFSLSRSVLHIGTVLDRFKCIMGAMQHKPLHCTAENHWLFINSFIEQRDFSHTHHVLTPQNAQGRRRTSGGPAWLAPRFSYGVSAIALVQGISITVSLPAVTVMVLLTVHNTPGACSLPT